MGRGPSPFSPQALKPLLHDLGLSGRVYVALSGGADSTALLLALHELAPGLGLNLAAVHVNHGIHPEAPRWARHCEDLCRSLDVDLHLAGPPEGSLAPGSPEERLRRYRHDAFTALLSPGETLCTAHHRQDQAETLLLALLRGSGPAGLAAMPASRPLGHGRLLRPLLGIDRDALEHWLRTRGVRWITDPSNARVDADRNFLRHEILPRLRSRWPAVDRALATSAGLQAEAVSWLAEAAGLALAGRTPAPNLLDLSGLDPASPALRTILGHWLRQAGAPVLPRVRLEELCRQLSTARNDGRIGVEWAGYRLRHHRGRLWLDSDPEPAPLASQAWDATGPLQLGAPVGTLELVSAEESGPWETGAGPNPVALPAGAPPFTVRGRQAGDRLRTPPSGRSRDLKSWLSASLLPPWLRDFVPVVPGEDSLAVLGDAVLDPALAERLRRQGLALRWRPSDAGLAWAWEQCRASLLGVE